MPDNKLRLAGHDIDLFRPNAPEASESLFHLSSLYGLDKLFELKERMTTVDLSELGTKISQ
ncbi:hypothetical protein [Photorhabdus luminescens]|uniref:Uncharacterized protein n=1 Tax=Photorhabdus luminescens subsp. sonorensis TaxID=1173677 RepID=A0A5C4RNA6_PHOLU|nr:hypothetical protein [Photorhabdus luminescens]TNH45472.1 hypothetical protein EP164_01965 [Photorhabdus luminescens subsp. sonorensis]